MMLRNKLLASCVFGIAVIGLSIATVPNSLRKRTLFANSLAVIERTRQGEVDQAIRVLQAGGEFVYLPRDVAAAIVHRTLTDQSGSARVDPQWVEMWLAYVLQRDGFSMTQLTQSSHESHGRLLDALMWMAHVRPNESNRAARSNPVNKELGPEQIADSEFNDLGEFVSDAWRSEYWAGGANFSQGVYAIGLDQDSSSTRGSICRIQGIYAELPFGGLEHSRAGVWASPVTFEPNERYQISFFYKTQGSDELATVYFGQGSAIGLDEYRLPPTRGKWRHASIAVSGHGSARIQIQPLVRLWGVGALWFDGLSIRQVADRNRAFQEKNVVPVILFSDGSPE